MQLQHCLTIYWARRLVQLTLENIANSPVGVSPFLFRPPNGLAAVADRDTPSAIARQSLLRSEIAVGLSHRDLTLLAHSRRPLEHRRPHLHRGVYVYVCVYVCVCVCVCVCVLNSKQCVKRKNILFRQKKEVKYSGNQESRKF